MRSDRTALRFLEGWFRTAGGALKLIFWLQLLRHRLFGVLARHYTFPWLAALAVLGASAAMLLAGADARNFDARLMLVSFCLPGIVGAYVIGRYVPLLAVALAVFIPGTLTITPTVSRSNPFFSEPDPADQLITGDLSLFMKGAGTCLCLLAISLLLQKASRMPSSRRLPPRWAVSATILVSGLLGLEMLRIAVQLAPRLPLPWARTLTAFMSEPGWPYAIVVWLWINTAYLLARYDARLIAHLLRRTGHSWGANDVAVSESYMVDELLKELAAEARPVREVRSRRHKRPRG